MRLARLFLLFFVFVLLAYPVLACIGSYIDTIYYNDESKKVIDAFPYHIKDVSSDYCEMYNEPCVYLLPAGWKLSQCVYENSEQRAKCVDYDAIVSKTTNYEHVELDKEVVFQPQNFLLRIPGETMFFSIPFLLTLVVLVIIWYLSKKSNSTIIARNLLFALSISIFLFNMPLGYLILMFSSSCGTPWTLNKFHLDVSSLVWTILPICIIAACALHFISKLKEGKEEKKVEKK